MGGESVMFYIYMSYREDSNLISSPIYNDTIKSLLEELEEVTSYSPKSIDFVFTGDFVKVPWYLETIYSYVLSKDHCINNSEKEFMIEIHKKLKSELSVRP
jgi:hypothetical protein